MFLQRNTGPKIVEGLFGILIIQLPSNYTGGKLIVYHQGKKSEFDYSGPDYRSNCYFTSFYVDCQHEVEKVTKGYRLCLIYNLVYKGLDECPVPAGKQVSTIVSAMREWEEDIEVDCPTVMTFLLEHKYSKGSLSLHLLKNCDQAVVDVLSQANAEVDFDVYVGQVHLTERWLAYYDFDDEKYEITDFDDASVHAILQKSEEHTLSQIDVDKDSFVPEDFFDYIDPIDKEYANPYDEYEDGFILNDNITVDKWYEWAALFLWPVKKRMDLLGLDSTITLFEQDVIAGRWGVEDVKGDIKREISRRDPSVPTFVLFLRALKVTADIILIAKMLDDLAFEQHYILSRFIKDDTFCSIVVSIGQEYGCDVVKSPLLTMFTRNLSGHIEEYCSFLKKMITLGGGTDLCKSLLVVIVKAIADKEDDASNSSCDSYSSWVYCRTYESKKFVSKLFSLLTAVGSNDLFNSAITTLCTKPLSYPVLETLGPALVDFYKSAEVPRDGPLQLLVSYCILQLEFTCPCKECMYLIEFLKDPTDTRHRIKIAKGRRWHFYQLLDSNGINAARVTERRGSTHSLVIAKNNALLKRNIRKHQQKQALLASLWPLLSVTGVASDNGPPAKKQKVASDAVTGSVLVISSN